MKNMMKPRSQAERLGFWVVVAAAGVALLVLAAVVLPVVFHAAASALVLAAFVAFLSALNSRALAEGANRLVGRRLFPLVQADERAIRRMVQMNALLTFGFAFVYNLLPFGPIISALLMVGAVAGAVMFLRRARTERQATTPLYTVERNDPAA